MEKASKTLIAVSEQTKFVKLFYCYAQKDEKLKDELEKHLAVLKRQGQISEWSHRMIEPGTNWAQSIDAHLNTADIILLLMSPDFLNSEYCYNVGMQRAIERHKAREVCVIPIILRPVAWEGTPVSQLQALPEDAKPVTLWDNRDSAFCAIARGIRRAIDTYQPQEKSEQIKGKEIRRGSKELDTTIKTNEHKHDLQVPYEIINTKEAIHLFHGLMQSENKKRIFRIIGDANMGKSYLLNQVFRPLSRDVYQTHCIVLDLRNPAHTILDMIYMIRTQLDSYVLDEDTWEKIFSTENPYRNSSLLTSYVVKELKKLDKPVLFLIDSVESAKKTTIVWVTEVLLTALVSSLPQVRIVMVGRLLPEAHGSYVELCNPQPPSPPYRLRYVEDEEAYIAYCKRLNVKLVEQSIRDFAYACDYTPGTFATLIHAKFLSPESVYE